MPNRPKVVAFDVFGTLFPLSPLAQLLPAGLGPNALELWFARTLRDAFALAVTGDFHPFSEVAGEALRVLLAEEAGGVDPALSEALIQRMSSLPPYVDVAEAFDRLATAGIRLVTLSNGSVLTAQNLLKQAKLDRYIDQMISAADVRCSKPCREVYEHLAAATREPPPHVALVSAHAWDVHGAKRAGLIGAWVKRAEPRYPSVMLPPDVQGKTLIELADALLLLPVER
jgi:2-haloacid dehalogenase